MGKKRLNYVRFLPQTTDGQGEFAMQMIQITATQITQFDFLQVLPNPFVGIQFRGIGRQPFKVHAALSTQKFFHLAGAMNPYASAPWHRNSGSSCFCSAESLGTAPGNGRANKPSGPCWRAADNHWLTAPLVTPKNSAISHRRQPCWSSVQARKRRDSFQSIGMASIRALYSRGKKLSALRSDQ